MTIANRFLGRKAVVVDSRTVKLGTYLAPTLPVPPPAVSWSKQISSWGVMLNDQLGDCTIAGCGHAVQTWSANLGNEITVSDSTVLAAYEAWDGYNPSDPSTDQGGIELNVLKSWKADGFGGHKIAAFASVNPQNITEVKQAINLFGGIYIGMDVPNFIMNNIPQVWDIVANDGGIDGGHCVFVVGYNETLITFISWGSVYQMTIPYWNKYVDESYALVGEDFFAAQGVDPAGFSLAQITADINQIH